MNEGSTHEDAVNENPDNEVVKYFYGRKWQEGPVFKGPSTARPEGVIYDFNGRYKILIEDENASGNP